MLHPFIAYYLFVGVSYCYLVINEKKKFFFTEKEIEMTEIKNKKLQ